MGVVPKGILNYRRTMKVELPKVFPVAAAFAFFISMAMIPGSAAETKAKESMQITSTAFSEGAQIPPKYTCEDRNVSPPLKWSGVPKGTRSLVLIADDPDAPAGTWIHWVMYDLPQDSEELAEDTPKSESLSNGAKQGMNSFRQLGYGGPCPPPGKAHRYFFKLYALDTVLNLKPAASSKDVERAMEKHVLGEGHLMGTYKRG
jgi:Raf kinase inhibitor-like YbhB/YbcL family protein